MAGQAKDLRCGGKMGTRKAHSKSRTGCGQCKKRRIKCDERPPRCYNCTRRELRCDYEALGLEEPDEQGLAVRWRDSQLPSGQLSLKGPVHIHPIMLSPSNSDLNMQHLELLHHFITSTYNTFGPNEHGKWVWKVTIPKEAMTYQFLMHTILALAAIHLIYLRGGTEVSKENFTAAQYHYSQALHLFRSNVQDVTSANCCAAMAFSYLIVIFTAGLERVKATPGNHDYVGTIVAVLVGFRGCSSLFRSCRHFIDARYAKERIALTDDPAPMSIEASLTDALDMIEKTISSRHSTEQYNVYQTAVEQLRICLWNASRDLMPKFHWRSWILTVPQEYFTLLEEKDQMALVILAHWTVSIKGMFSPWFLGNWRPKLVEQIRESIGPEWEHLLKYPLDETQTRRQGAYAD